MRACSASMAAPTRSCASSWADRCSSVGQTSSIRKETSMYLTQGLHTALRHRPDAVALRCAGRSWTFRELGDRVARLAGALRSLGVSDGERVAMYSLNSTRYI